jgi:hypothetical protein
MVAPQIKEESDAAFDGFRKAAAGLFEITISGQIEKEGGFYSWAYLKTSKRMAQALAADREILLLVTTFRDQQARTIKVASELIEASGGRLETSIVVILHADAGGNAKLQSWGREKGITVLPVVMDRVRSLKKPEELESVLCRELYSFDLFDVSGPVSDDRNFYGRRTEAQDMARQLQSGQIRACLGIRKIGKTSIVNRIVDETRSNHSCLSLMVDASRDDIWKLDAAQLVNSIACGIEALSPAQPYGVVSADRSTTTLEQAAKRLQLATAKPEIPLIIFFDEIDYITPGSPTAPHWRADFNPFWRNMRAVYQEAARARGRLSFFISGVSSKWFRSEAIDGVENAALALVPEEYLSPLPRGASTAMIKQLARRVGLQLNEEICDLIAEAGADIPFWIRKAGSFIHRHTEIPGRPTPIPTETVVALLKTFVETEGGVLAQVALAHLFRVYPDLQKDAHAVASGNQKEGKPERLGILARYGVIRRKTDGSFVIAGPMMATGLHQIALDSTTPRSDVREDAAAAVISAPTKLGLEDLGDWAEELALLGKRRNLIEKKLRALAFNFLRFDSLQKGTKTVDRILAALARERREALRHIVSDDIGDALYWLELIQLISKEWDLFSRLFGDKAQFEQCARLINERPDAHAKNLDLADIALHRRALQFFETGLAKG